MTEPRLEAPLPGMTKLVIETFGWICHRCEHRWIPRNPTRRPTVCPSCKSPYWQTSRRTET